MTFTYRHTKYAAYIGYITQAIVNNLMPLLFVSFQNEFSLRLDKISLLITMNFGVQIVIDLIAAKYADRIGYRASMLIAHTCVVIGLVGMTFLPFLLPPFIGLCICSAVNAIGGGLTEVVVSPIVEALPGESKECAYGTFSRRARSHKRHFHFRASAILAERFSSNRKIFLFDEKESAMSILHSFYCWGQVSVVLLSTIYFTIFGIRHWRYLPLLWALVPLFNILLCAKVPIRSLNEEGESMPVGKLFRLKIFWLFLILMICAGASELAMSQWASFFAEKGLQVSKTMGDLLGPCAFAVLMGSARTFFGLKGEQIDLRKFILASSILCIASYMLAVFAPHPVLSLIGCALCGFSVGIMWPGTFSLAAKFCPQGGTAMFAILALAGDIGCSSGPTLSGFIANSSGDLRGGLFTAAVFPLILFCGVWMLRKQEYSE